MPTFQTALLKGHFHPVYCEDFLLTEQLAPDLHLAAVMDGCSMGKESHFASALIAKILRKAIKVISWDEFAGRIPALSSWALEEIGKRVMALLFDILRETADLLLLDQKELLSTLVMTLIRPSEQAAWAIAVGDGYIATSDSIIDIDQQNRPDYIGYHMNADFTKWFDAQEQIYHFTAINELIIATDGPGAIRKMEKEKTDFEGDFIHYLFSHPEHMEYPRGLHKKLELLEKRNGLVATDDIAMVRVVW